MNPAPHIQKPPTPWLDVSIAANGRTVQDNFADWFGESKVVDSQGQPLVVHHGTRADFDAFDLNKQGRNGSAIGSGFYFSNSRDVASGYGDRLMAVHLSAQKPDFSLKRKTITRQQALRVIEDMEREDPDLLSNHGDVKTEGRRAVVKAALDDVHATATNDAEVITALLHTGGADRDAVMASIVRHTGKDGFVVDAEIASAGAQAGDKVYVVLRPCQIKSATENSGLYLKDSSSITDKAEAHRLQLAQKALSSMAPSPHRTPRLEIGA